MSKTNQPTNHPARSDPEISRTRIKKNKLHAHETYCRVWSLSTRREFLCVCMYLRAMRLPTLDHPLGELFSTWNRSPIVQPHGVFGFAKSIRRRLARHALVTDGDQSFAEPLRGISLAPWVAPLRTSRYHQELRRLTTTRLFRFVVNRRTS